MLRFQGKTALVTGAATGIGQAIASRFAAEGARVAVNHVGPAEEAAEAMAKAGAGALFVRADVADEAQVRSMFEQVIAKFGRLDILVNNAGIQRPAPSHEVDMEAFDRILGVNLRGSFLCCREAIRHFLRREGGGVIVNNSSVHELIPKPKYASYAITKAGLGSLTQTLALEYAGRGIRVNAVGPGCTITPINSPWVSDPVATAEVMSHIPMGRAASADEIAGVFAFLASDEASYITGQTLFACGGLTLYPEFRTAWASGE